MNLVCIICSDPLTPSAEIYSTNCGHIFHHVCLMQWMERSKSCPQCRFKTTEKSIHRIYLNLANTDSNVDDASTLLLKYDNAQYQLTAKEKDMKNLTEKYNKVKTQNFALREELIELENKVRIHDSIVQALKDQISYFKSKAKEKEKYVEDVGKLKTRIKQMEAVDVAINGSRDEVTNMLKSEVDPESLVMLVATLKKALLDAEKKKINVEHKYKQFQCEITRLRQNINEMELTNKQLRQELESVRRRNTPEKKLFNGAIPKVRNGSSALLGKSSLVNDDSVLVLDSPSVEAKVVQIKESDSPYFCVKKSGAVGFFEKDFGQKVVKPKQISSSLFKRATAAHTSLKPYKSETLEYDGFGGQREKEIFPTSSGIKRHRTDPVSSLHKVRKTTSKK